MDKGARQFSFPFRALLSRCNPSLFSLGPAADGYYQSERMRPGPASRFSNGRHFHNNDSCILNASRLITLSPLKKCSFVKIDAPSSLPRRP